MSTTPKVRTIAPTHYRRRSQLYRRHLLAGARFEEVAGSAVVAEYTETADEANHATQLALVDLSTLSRVGFKGAGAPAWLKEQGLRLPDSPNQSKRQEDGSLIARLSANEFLILSNLTSDSAFTASLKDSWSLESTEAIYLLPRGDSHCWFALTGAYAPTTLAKVCGVDFRTHKFSEYEVAQTSLAGINAIILRNDFATTPCFLILSDVSSAEYLWEALLDAMAEFSGSAVGMVALRALETPPEHA